MKKILSILMVGILGCVLFAGCGQSKKTESNENKISAAGDEIVSGGNVYDAITSVYKDVNIEYKSEDEQLTGKKNLYIGIKLDKKDKIPQVLSEEYNKVCKEILKKVSPILAKYENINNIQFQAFVNNKPDEDTNIYCLRQINDKSEIYYDLGAVTEAKNFELKTKAEKEEEEKENAKQYMERKVKEEKDNKSKEQAENNAKGKAIKEENKATLITATQEVVKKNLKAPSTAKFPWSFAEYNIKETNSENKDMTIYYISGYVDAENSFGAKIRNNFIVKMECTNDLSKYRVLDVQVKER